MEYKRNPDYTSTDKKIVRVRRTKMEHDVLCDGCGGAGLKGGTMQNPRVCGMCHGYGVINPSNEHIDKLRDFDVDKAGPQKAS